MKIIEYYKNVKLQQNKSKFIIAKILMKLRLSQYFIIKQKHYNLRFYPTKISRELWIDPKFWSENWTLRDNFFWNFLKLGDTVVDTGSHIGQVTLEAAKKVGSSGKVYSIEPHPTLFKYLQGNVKLNNLDNIKFFNVALGEENSTIKFVTDSTDPSSRVSNDHKGVNVPLRKLDELKINENKINLLKLYAIGFEKFVLLGASNIMKKTDCIHFRKYEKEKSDEYNYDYFDVFKILFSNGFKIFQIQKNNILKQINEDSETEYDTNAMDYVAVKNLDEFLTRTKFKVNS
tara:strand:+ start:1268 stop:2131 length:864 start_codon:yes stop_codon:yes gene_type:complete